MLDLQSWNQCSWHP